VTASHCGHFIPGDSEKKLNKTAGFSSDALILDLEDSVASSREVPRT
jgi:citrate lyase subunit beta/citryl-CoA lyase